MAADGPLNIGVVGCGSISDVYFSAISRSPALTLRGVASRGMESAARQTGRYGGEAMSFDRMLSDPTIELVVNLTPAIEHAMINRRVIEANKHLYVEKPFALKTNDAAALLKLAASKGLQVGGAPDTFFGAAHQAARAVIDDGVIGRPVHGSCFVGFPGVELFHPNPAGFYKPGGEPPYEIGPYYLTQLISLLGPVREVIAQATRGTDARTIRLGPMAGTTFPVQVPTTFCALIVFEIGTVMTPTFSLDALRHDRQPTEIYGTAGTLLLSDPNFFGDAPRPSRQGGDWEMVAIEGRPLSLPNRDGHRGERRADYRGIGLVEMALAIRTGRAHRTGPDLLLHVVEVTESILRSAESGERIVIRSRCIRPAPLGGAKDEAVLEMMPSPWEDVPVRPSKSGWRDGPPGG